MAPRISNLPDWSGYVLARLRRELEATRDPELESLYEELAAYPGITEHDPAGAANPDDIMLMHQLRLDDADLALFCTFTTFGTACDLTLAELTFVAFYPADPRTAEALAAGVSDSRLD
jgi:transcription regulator MmyB-like protein